MQAHEQFLHATCNLRFHAFSSCFESGPVCLHKHRQLHANMLHFSVPLFTVHSHNSQSIRMVLKTASRVDCALSMTTVRHSWTLHTDYRGLKKFHFELETEPSRTEGKDLTNQNRSYN